MRRSAIAIFIILAALIAVACVALGPEVYTTRVPLATGTPTAEEIGRGVRGGVGVMDATATPGVPDEIELFQWDTSSVPNCATLIAGQPTVEASDSDTYPTISATYFESSKRLVICNTAADQDATCRIVAESEARGRYTGTRNYQANVYYSGARSAAYNDAYGVCDGYSGNLGQEVESAVGVITVVPSASHVAQMYGYGEWCTNVYGDWQYEISCTLGETGTPTPTPTITPTPTATPTSTATPTPTPTLLSQCAITEILASMDEGTPTPYIDWNGRNGVGVNDEFVEIMCPTERSVAKFTLDNGVCFFVYPDDTIVGPLKAIFSDEMLESDGSACPGFDAGDTWTLNNAQSTPISTREVPTMAAPGNAWAAEAWRTPTGAWTEGTPSPGTGPP